MSTEFVDVNNLSSSDGFKPADNEGALCYFHAIGEEKGVVTENGSADVVIADVVILDGPNAGEAHDGAFIFSVGLKKILGNGRANGTKALGRPTKVVLGGGKSMWTLTAFTDADVKTYKAWESKHVAAAPF